MMMKFKVTLTEYHEDPFRVFRYVEYEGSRSGAVEHLQIISNLLTRDMDMSSPVNPEPDIDLTIPDDDKGLGRTPRELR